MRCTRTCKAEQATSERRFVGEIVPLRMAGAEARDEGADVADIEDLAALAPLLPPDGTHTSGNTSLLHDAAAVVVIVSARGACRARRAARAQAGGEQHAGRGRRRGGARAGRGAGEAAAQANGGFSREQLGLVEMSETSAAQALALRDAFDLDDDELSPDGGALARGHPLGGGERRQRGAALHAHGAGARAERGGAATAPSRRAPSAGWASPPCSRASSVLIAKFRHSKAMVRTSRSSH